MRRVLILAALAAGGVVGTAGGARAEGDLSFGPVRVPDIHARLGPHTTSVTWPSVSPPGWYSNTYRHQWYFPWYAYYNFSSGPYANWMAGGGSAGYADHGPAGYYYYPGLSGPPAGAMPAISPAKKGEDKPKDGGKAGMVSVTLPADAKLLFNGVAASGTGGIRAFQTPPLAAGQNYTYELTAEVTRDGRTERVTETVIVRAGEIATVTLAPSAVTTAGAK